MTLVFVINDLIKLHININYTIIIETNEYNFNFNKPINYSKKIKTMYLYLHA